MFITYASVVNPHYIIEISVQLLYSFDFSGSCVFLWSVENTGENI